MDAEKTAILSSCGNMTSFTVGDRVIRFRTSDHIVRYEKVTKWDNGYIECLATYDNPPHDRRGIHRPRSDSGKPILQSR